jgi:hypothetical protein
LGTFPKLIVEVLPHPGLFTATPLPVDPAAPVLLEPPVEVVVPPDDVPPLEGGFVPPVAVASLVLDAPPFPPVADVSTRLEPPVADEVVAWLLPPDEPPVLVLLLLVVTRDSEPPAPPLLVLVATLDPPLLLDALLLDPPALLVFPPDDVLPLATLADEEPALPPEPELAVFSEQLATSKAKGSSQCACTGIDTRDRWYFVITAFLLPVSGAVRPTR